MTLRRLSIGLAIALLCAASIFLSEPFARDGMSSQTAHVLSSMRAFDDWGFWHLRGVSVLIPRQPEMEGVDLRTLTMQFNEAVYFSYPMGWLVLPYAAFRLTHAIFPHVTLGPAFLMGYNVLVNRFLGVVLLFLLLREIVRMMMGDRLSALHRDWLAVLGCSVWILSSPVLYWTQNAYGMDQAILIPVMGLLLLVARHRCRIDTCSTAERWMLGLLGFLACSIDWYGWVSVAVMIVVSVLYQCLSRRGIPSRPMLWSCGALVAGMAGAGMIFAAQALSFADAASQLKHKYAVRSVLPEEYDLFSILWDRWVAYLPLARRWVAAPFLAASIVTCSLLVRRSRDRAAVVVLLLMILLPPFLWTAFLPQHSVEHLFALLKFSPIVPLGVVCIGGWVLISMRSLLRLSDGWMTTGIITCGIIIAILTVSTAKMQIFDTQNDMWGKEIARLLDATLAPGEIPLSASDLLLGSRPSHKIWYVNRWIYTPGVLVWMQNERWINADVLKDMHPVFLEPVGESAPEADLACAKLWKDSGISVQGKTIRVCRTDTLREFYLTRIE